MTQTISTTAKHSEESQSAYPLSIYELWLPMYEDPTGEKSAFERATEDLVRLADLGVKQVYLPPFTKTGGYCKPEHMNAGSKEEYIGKQYGSLYAVSDPSQGNPRFFSKTSEALNTNNDTHFLNDNGDLTSVGKQVKAFTEKAKSLGIDVIADIVMNHLAFDSPYIQKAKDMGHSILATYDGTDRPIVVGMDQHGRMTVSSGYDCYVDVAALNYKNGQTRNWIIDNVQTPYVKALNAMGIHGGLRVDFPYFDQQVLHQVINLYAKEAYETTGQKPIVFYELPKQERDTLKGVAHLHPQWIAGVGCATAAIFYPNARQINLDTLVDLTVFDGNPVPFFDGSWLTDSDVPPGTPGIRPGEDAADWWRFAEMQRNNEGMHSVALGAYHDAPSPITIKFRTIKEAVERNHITLEKLEEKGYLADGVTANDLRGRELRESDISSDAILRLVKIQQVFSVLAHEGGAICTLTGDEFQITEQPSVFHGQVIPKPDEQRPQVTVTLVEERTETEHRITLDSQQYEQLLTEARESPTNETTIQGANGKKYRITLVRGFDHAYFEGGDPSQHQPTDMLIMKPPVTYIDTLIEQEQQRAANGENRIIPFLRQIYAANNARPPADLDSYTHFRMSERDPDVIYVARHLSPIDRNQPSPLHEVFAVDVSVGRDRSKEPLPSREEMVAEIRALMGNEQVKDNVSFDGLEQKLLIVTPEPSVEMFPSDYPYHRTRKSQAENPRTTVEDVQLDLDLVHNFSPSGNVEMALH